MNVAVLGASNKPDRYSFKTARMLRDMGCVPYPAHPALPEVDGIQAWPLLRAIPSPIDTVTVHLSVRNLDLIAEQLLDSELRHVIFNPGAENPELADQFRQRGKEVLHARTLVLLTTGEFVKPADKPAPPRHTAFETNPS
jgi:predicted CoA-binding protein